MQKAPSVEGKINILNYLKIKNWTRSKNTLKRMKRQACRYEKLSVVQISDKGLSPEYIKNA